MAKKEKTVVYVVDFLKKEVLLREELSNGTSKKEQEKMEKINSAVDCLKADLLSKAS